MQPYKTQGIVLNRRDWKEADKLFIVLTPDRGKIQVIGRGVKKSKSKLGSHLEPFLVADLMIAPGRRMDLVAAAASRHNFARLKSSIQKIRYGWYCCEVLDNLIKWERPDRDIFDLLELTLRILNDDGAPSQNPPSRVQSAQRDFPARDDADKSVFMLNIFVWKVLFFLGYAPELYRCLSCGQPLQPKQNFFHSVKGGILCGFCLREKLNPAVIKPVTASLIKVLRFTMNNSLERALRVKIRKEMLGELTCLTEMFLSQYLDKKPHIVLAIGDE